MAWNILPGTVTDLTATEALAELSFAIQERAQSGVGGITIEPPLEDLFQITELNITKMEDAIDEMLRLSFPSPTLGFINQTDNSGDWDGLNTFPPFWTEADALAEIGAVSRIRLDVNFGELWEVPVDWLNQSMELVNLMQYVGDRDTVRRISPTETAQKTATDTTQAGVIADYAAAPTTTNGFIIEIGQLGLFISPNYTLETQEYRNLQYSTASERAKLDSVDTYAFMEAHSVAGTNNYDSMGNPWATEDAYNIIRTDLSPITLSVIDFIFNDLSQPDVETVNNTSRGWKCVAVGNSGIQGHIVYKYTFDKQT